MQHALHVLVRASDPITQAGLAAHLESHPDIEIVTGPVAAPVTAARGPAGSWRHPVTVATAAVAAPPAVAAQPVGAGVAPAARTVAGGRAFVPRQSASTAGPAGGSPGVTPGVDVALVSAEAVDDGTLRTVREIHQGGVPVVLVVATLDSHDLTAAVDAGVVGLLRRAGATPDTLLAAVRGAASGEGFLPPDLLGPLLAQVRQVSTQVLAPRGLTFSGMSERELTVLRLVSEGHDTREIGRRLCYSERTVKNVLQDVTRRFGLRNRSHAVAYAFRHGLL
ncbi:response regulator transcription factor [Frankia sp. QA3]|uniref:helix-turn-helix transcriptional regulator n=1 Tax=Frankia sp. QA3 TaxID=710111 RepID=UPI000269C00E|nr:response regulator transcription factor [Frankia sp. QA3]EIV92976.1 response regulator containing a CheY-like receiver domain and an HTH DNA-binding domain [Frankia sp. QA3]